MLYTRKGDSGTTKDFKSGPGVRKSKSSCQTEALGALDELNSFIGLVKVRTASVAWRVPPQDKTVPEIMEWTQNNLFTVQAEVAGADKHVNGALITEVEAIIDTIEKEMPPIKTFFISGGTEEAALLDISRTLARKAERRAIAGIEAGEFTLADATRSFLNRLSSLFYALARYANYKAGKKETAPWYN